MARRSLMALDGVGTLVRLGLAAVWLVAAAVKLAAPGSFAVSVKAYQVFPDSVASLVAAILPFVEVALGLLVLLGVGTRIVAVLSALLLVIYIAGIVEAWARGLSIDCGCFSRGGPVAAGQTQYPQDILRDIGFLALAVWLTVRPRTFASVDGWLTTRHGPDEAAEDEDGVHDSGPARSALGRQRP